MNTRFLVALDGSALAEAALRAVQPLAREVDNVHLLHVIPSFATPVGLEPEYHLVLHDRARGYLKEVRARLRALDGGDLVQEGDAAHAITQTALKLSVHVIAMGTHARTAPARWVMGSVADKVVRAAGVPVLLVPKGAAVPKGALRYILVAVDGTRRSAAILDDVRPLAAAAGARLGLLHVVDEGGDPMPQFADDVTKLAWQHPERALQKMADALDEKGIAATTAVAEGDPVKQILATAKKLGAGLIAMSTHAPDGLERALAGSVAEGVLRRSPVPVLLRKVR